jgi:hypothetical protein
MKTLFAVIFLLLALLFGMVVSPLTLAALLLLWCIVGGWLACSVE